MHVPKRKALHTISVSSFIYLLLLRRGMIKNWQLYHTKTKGQVCTVGKGWRVMGRSVAKYLDSCKMIVIAVERFNVSRETLGYEHGSVKHVYVYLWSRFLSYKSYRPLLCIHTVVLFLDYVFEILMCSGGGRDKSETWSFMYIRQGGGNYADR